MTERARRRGVRGGSIREQQRGGERARRRILNEPSPGEWVTHAAGSSTRHVRRRSQLAADRRPLRPTDQPMPLAAAASPPCGACGAAAPHQERGNEAAPAMREAQRCPRRSLVAREAQRTPRVPHPPRAPRAPRGREKRERQGGEREHPRPRERSHPGIYEPATIILATEYVHRNTGGQAWLKKPSAVSRAEQERGSQCCCNRGRRKSSMPQIDPTSGASAGACGMRFQVV